MQREFEKRLQKLETKRLPRPITPEEADGFVEEMEEEAIRTGIQEIDVFEDHPLFSVGHQIRILDLGLPGVELVVHRHPNREA